MIHIGTSGYSYADWKPFFYPESMAADQFLAFYASHFGAVELNFSYYRMPTATQLQSMVDKTDGKLLFAVKAHQSITHQRTASPTDIKLFADAVSPLAQSNALGAVLLQFPYSFHQNEQNRAYLSRLRDSLPFALVAEFRNVEWATPAVFNWLKKLNVGFCCVDEPALPGLMPRLHVCTSAVAYVRFHGRNHAKWYTHNQAFERYDYRYASSELSEWIAPIAQLNDQADRTLVFFNNHFQAKAVDSARQLSHMLHLWPDA
ncbi:MAG: DUF72 domain-containing protein [Deltaproteobacteria bacterium]|nr:DUF72 domain-containing protein [Deltaproteobacteria bacterium]